VINSGAMSGLASEVSRSLKKSGYTAGQVRDRNSGDPTNSEIRYGAGADTDARNLASLLGMQAPSQPDPDVKAGHIQLTVDTNFSMPPPPDETSDDSSSTTTTTTSKSSSHSGYGYSTSTYPTPDQGKPIDGGGVPCVN
jgi:hypothetical protein